MLARSTWTSQELRNDEPVGSRRSSGGSRHARGAGINYCENTGSKECAYLILSRPSPYRKLEFSHNHIPCRDRFFGWLSSILQLVREPPLSVPCRKSGDMREEVEGARRELFERSSTTSSQELHTKIGVIHKRLQTVYRLFYCACKEGSSNMHQGFFWYHSGTAKLPQVELPE